MFRTLKYFLLSKNYFNLVNFINKRINKNITKGQTKEIGFSDDDPKNVDYILSHFALRDQQGRFRKGGKRIKVKYTGTH
jgi:hypothetical protein